jgi:5,10-methylenetetrahydromethanopterin reductase
MEIGACASGLRDSDVSGWIQRVHQLEGMGYAVLGMSDSFVSLAAAARDTVRPRLATMTTNPVTRHPRVVASDIAVITDLSGGRATLVVGRGFSQVLSLGLKPATTRLLGDFVQTVRQLLRGEEAHWQGQLLTRLPVDQRESGATSPIPVYIAAYGPRTMRLAGKIADGVLIASAANPESMRGAIAHVRDGALEAQRNPAEVSIWAMVRSAVRDSRAEAIDDIKGLLAPGVLNLPKDDPYIPSEVRERIENLRELYRLDHHATWTGGNAGLLDELGLSEFAADRLAICGTPDECRARMAALADLGVSCVNIPIIGRDSDLTLRRFAREVWPEASTG